MKIVGALSACFVLYSGVGCTAEIQDSNDNKAISNLDPARFNKLIEDTKFLLGEADKNLNVQELKKRMSGVALRMRTAQYELAQKGYQDKKLDALSFKTAVETVTKEESWPRYMMLISQTVGDSAPYLIVFEQSNVRDNYKISNWVRLFPKTSITSSKTVSEGIELYKPKASNLVEKPETVLGKYSEYLNGNKDLNKYFAEDTFSAKFWEEKSKLSESLRDIADVDTKIYSNPDKFVSFKLNDGSALVVTSFKYDVKFLRGNHNKEGKVSGALQVLLGDNNKIDSDIVATYNVSIAFIVPEKTAKDNKIRPVGAERVLISATKK